MIKRRGGGIFGYYTLDNFGHIYLDKKGFLKGKCFKFTLSLQCYCNYVTEHAM